MNKHGGQQPIVINDAGQSLADHLLVAMPSMADPRFTGTVIYLVEHSPVGTLGLVINKPTDISLRSLLAKIELNSPIPEPNEMLEQAVLVGGPVHTDRGFVLHEPIGHWNHTVGVTERIGMTSSKDILEAIARGDGPQRALVMLGYAGWAKGQLESELAQNSWLTIPADPDLLFDTPMPERLTRALGLLGVDPMNLSMSAGHA